MLNKITKIALFLICIFFSHWGYADQPDKKIALWISDKVVNYIQENGISGLQREMHSNAHVFRYKDIYAFVLDEEANMIAHGANSALVGRNMYNIQASDGVRVFQLMEKHLKGQQKGWVHYVWSNPINKKIQLKKVFIQRVNHYYVAVGIYLPAASTQHLQKHSTIKTFSE